ncbi:MAG: peptide chain release factor-like protein [Planctomycetes bacterium]|jgi:hypothetical protein|nr:peptide chain release factor-like protein [Planctomycetota bacterium]MBT4559320.1 peptide chain release factor-like protein [Planctomycetota bacterium]MBT5100980.1 peptide chain release factor-like protein [Planctomycetota bacterium]MBT5120512.1 peptide chain release factor-like protein [Planctomycetota bacterium]MBT7012300.1 peptide chain release factor-like protein [Planctomycetota bacterium]
MHPAALPADLLERETHVERTRASGPGGQHRNRVQTAIRLRHEHSGVLAQANERRSQHENLKVAYFRLRVNLAIEFRTPLTDSAFVSPGEYQPSEPWQSRLRKGRIKVNPTHADFPGVLAEVLDRLRIDQDDISRTATAFGVSVSQLVKFLALEARALQNLNARRKTAGLNPLRG